MNDKRLADFEAKLRAELHSLEESDTVGSEDQQTVMLDQQSVGRLSRMDALQRQALANANQRRRDARKLKIQAALTRCQDGEFGYCDDCGEEIAAKRLELDPTAAKCIECANG
ncbi:MAG: TraR/DksA C4-type zinc finger protein [Boseongicola sp.]|nr:TraR/DksA C4-type zinc finger protein [Boseongicola sp.]MDD9976590.1 TraR/DksA C4-type zinc finger protein [Boseongicola sp.]